MLGRVATLLAATLVGCATIQEPPGGPPDTTPPAIVSTRPDSGAIVPGWHDAAVIQFNEVIDERSGGGLDKLITLSPVPKELSVSWKRSAIAVKPKGGWRDSVVYQLTLAPGVADLRNNRLKQGRTIVFSTGGSIPATSITGTVLDWEQGRIATRALVQSVRLPDSLTYIGSTDSLGDFAIGSVPPGRYLVLASLDANNNRRIDPGEPFDSTTVQLDSAVSHIFWTFRHDTIGPRLSRAMTVDSLTLRLEFTQVLPPEPPSAGAVTVLALPDSTPLELAHVWLQQTFDSVAAAERAARPGPRDTTRADTTAKADTLKRPAPPPLARPSSPALARPGAADTSRTQPARADTSRAAWLLRERPKLGNVLVARLQAPLAPGGRYVVLGDVKNLIGARGTSRFVVVLPQRAAPPKPPKP